MKIVLYGIGVSAFVAKVRIVLDHKGLPFEEVPPPGGYGSAEYRVRVPAGSVPGMTVDGTPLHDSNAMMEFLDEVAPEPPLMPVEPLARARIRALLGFHDTRVEAAVRALFPLVKRDWRGEPEALEAACAGIEAALERLDEIDAPARVLAGEGPTLADLAYPCTLQMGAMLGAEMGRPLVLPPRIEDWAAQVSTLPAVARSLAIHAQAMEGWMAGFRRA
ncbi:glutathione S-transferase family protein [uncultured Albimonas sp.]|uniref:glutathione S-transferase family protein n=1 Tax=uncultured Albimonas sp. TaxID=1331701 RepID=UPI0030EDD85E